MDDREIILATLAYLRYQDKHADVSNDLWKGMNLSEEKQLHIRDILLAGELINIGTEKFYLRATARGITARPKSIDKNGYYINPQERFQYWLLRLGIIPVIYALFECIKDLHQFWLWLNHHCPCC